jgi:hypothetical protein
MSLLISRRTMLRGVGAAIALPWLEAMGPVVSWAAPAKKGESPAPNRMAFLYVPNGKNMADWTPKKEGADFDLPAILEPLKDLKGRAYASRLPQILRRSLISSREGAYDSLRIDWSPPFTEEKHEPVQFHSPPLRHSPGSPP